MLCVINWKKINRNKFMGNQQCNSHLPFPGQHYSFQEFFQTFPYLWSFSRVFKALKISRLNSRTFQTFPGSVRTLKVVSRVTTEQSVNDFPAGSAVTHRIFYYWKRRSVHLHASTYQTCDPLSDALLHRHLTNYRRRLIDTTVLLNISLMR